jgi:hormone-sensitive lipase
MCCVPRPKSDCYDQLILHFHGGSFVALTSRTSQTFTRRWATNFQVPILSVDYRLAPESTFPAALEDCYSVYLFVVNNLASHMNIRPRNIILAGDSAGGNLVMALTALILKNGVRAPNSLFLAYPQADLRQQFSPSRLNGLDDV